jgi:hypothetical protein
MPHWEYRTVLLYAFLHPHNHKSWRVKAINEQKIPNWEETKEYSSVADFCNQMGKQGWELITVHSENHPDLKMLIELYFKRSHLDKTP